MSDTITADKIGIFHYTLHNSEGDLLDSSREHGDPMPYLHGHSNIVPGLESALEGKSVGDMVKAEVPPAEGYGEYDETGFVQVHRKEFPAGEFDDVELGMSFQASDGDGQPVQLWLIKKEGAYAHFTTNHPLAGQTLHFDVEIVGIRDATEEELVHSHPHGIDGTGGHHHNH
jgi:FKBP-type peptidyl-prolyl cis-trans isomerase SlyD